MAAYTSLGAREIRTGDRTASVPLRAVTPELFGVLGVAPSLGASFSASATTVSGPPPVILSHRVWQELFDQRTDAIGRVFWIDDEAHTVIGVMPERFWFSDMDSPIWTRSIPGPCRRTRESASSCGVRPVRRTPRSTPDSRAASPTTRSSCPPASVSSP